MKWNNLLLEPVIITYNRSIHLGRTLRYFYDAGLHSMIMHVLDNASTDNTEEIVLEFQKIWPNLKYHKNKYNIGGNGNILRAVELSDSDYIWIIGDDDDWNLGYIEELLTVLAEGKPDLIRLGWLSSENSKGCYISAVDLVRDESMFFVSVCQISNTIIRRSIVSKYLPHAYLNSGDAYPHLVPVILSVQKEQLLVYTLSHQAMTYVPSSEPSYYFGDLEWHSGWFRTGRFFEDIKMRHKFLDDSLVFLTQSNPTWLNQLLILIKISLKFKLVNKKQGEYLISMIAYGNGRRFGLVLVFLIYCFTPRIVSQLLVFQSWRNKGVIDDKILSDRTRL